MYYRAGSSSIPSELKDRAEELACFLPKVFFILRGGLLSYLKTLRYREAEIAKIRFELAQVRTEKSELDFLVKALRVELEEAHSTASGSGNDIAELEEVIDSLQEQVKELSR